MSFFFTSHSGEVFEVALEDLPLPASPHPCTSFDGALAANPMGEALHVASAMKPFPLITVSNACDTPGKPVAALRTKKSGSRRKRSVSDQSWNGSGFEPQKILFAYNDYGELVDVEKLKRPVNSADLTVTETLRLILKAYHNEVCQRPLSECSGEQTC